MGCKNTCRDVGYRRASQDSIWYLVYHVQVWVANHLLYPELALRNGVWKWYKSYPTKLRHCHDTVSIVGLAENWEHCIQHYCHTMQHSLCIDVWVPCWSRVSCWSRRALWASSAFCSRSLLVSLFDNSFQNLPPGNAPHLLKCLLAFGKVPNWSNSLSARQAYSVPGAQRHSV